jgi:hypothetical protein
MVRVVEWRRAVVKGNDRKARGIAHGQMENLDTKRGKMASRSLEHEKNKRKMEN